MSGKKVVAAGHICLDITPVFPGKAAKRAEEILVPGKLLHMDGVDVHTGGAVANTGLALKILGMDVTLMGKIGEDAFGKMVLEILRQHGCEGDMLRSPDSPTSYSVVVAPPGIDRIFLHCPGANDTFCYEDLPFEKIADAALFHFGYPPLMRRMYEDGGEELERIFCKVKSFGTATSLDLAAVDADSAAGQADWRKILGRVLPHVDFFVPSVEELCFMLDRERYASWLERAAGGDVTEILDVERDIRPLAEEVLAMGAKAVLIKCGAPGMYLRTASEETLEQVGAQARLDAAAWAEQEIFEKSYVPQRVLSGTGAGDTSIAAFLAAMLSGKTPAEAMRLAAAEGASCVESYDALSGLRSLEDLEKKIAAGWEKCE